jgi:hypothetical protein
MWLTNFPLTLSEDRKKKEQTYQDDNTKPSIRRQENFEKE